MNEQRTAPVLVEVTPLSERDLRGAAADMAGWREAIQVELTSISRRIHPNDFYLLARRLRDSLEATDKALAEAIRGMNAIERVRP